MEAFEASMSAIDRLSAMRNFSSLTCGHESPNFTVLRVSPSSEITLICPACYADVAEDDVLASRPPLSPGECAFCERSVLVRMNIDFNMNICDECHIQDKKLQCAHAEAYRPRTDIIPDEVLQNVFIGQKDSAYNRKTLRSLGISNILICCNSLPAYHFPDDPTIKYHRIPIQDSMAQNIKPFLPSALAFISQAVLNGEGCLVHCNAGVSRSGSVVVEYIRRVCEPKPTVKEALASAKSKRPSIHPNGNFIRQITELESECEHG